MVLMLGLISKLSKKISAWRKKKNDVTERKVSNIVLIIDRVI